MPTSVVFTSVMPSMPVKDVPGGVNFYVKTLGFNLVTKNGDVFAIVSRNGVEIGLLSALAHDAVPGCGRCYIKVTGIEKLYASYSEKGVKVLHKLKVEPYGMKEFKIADPEGNEISFGQPEL
jgi:predicted enzyme related to lactoylglutathione lyase